MSGTAITREYRTQEFRETNTFYYILRFDELHNMTVDPHRLETMAVWYRYVEAGRAQE